MNDEAGGNEPLAIMIEERAAACRVVERPAETVLHQTGLMLVGGYFPDFLDADAEFLRLAPL